MNAEEADKNEVARDNAGPLYSGFGAGRCDLNLEHRILTERDCDDA